MIQYTDPNFLEYCKTVTNFMQNGVLVLKVGEDGQVSTYFVNDVALNAVGKSMDEYLQSSPYDFIYKADRTRAEYTVKKVISDGKASDTFRIIPNSKPFSWVRCNFQLYSHNEEKYIVINFTSVDELMGAQIRLQTEGDKWIDIVNSIPIGIAIFAIDTNQKVTTIAINDPLVAFSIHVGQLLDGVERKWTKEEMMILFNHSIYAFCCEEDMGLIKQMIDDSVTQSIAVCVFRLRGSTEENPIFIKSSCFSKEINSNLRNYYVTFENVTKDVVQELELEKNQDMLMDMSFHDAMTHVKNRNAYNIMLENCSRMHIRNVGVVFSDINGLKKVNDLLGHKYGDKMICKYADILTDFFDIDRIFRISGDEFVIIYPGVGRQEFLLLMEKMGEVIKESNDIASLGYIWEEDTTDIKLQIDKAEQIMYVQKRNFYECESSLNSKHRPILLKELISDFDNGRFKMYLQPKADINTSKIIGAEALIRKVDDKGKVILPYEFIPQLEKEKLIPKVDFHMLEKTCQYLEMLKAAGKTDFVISVNMSRVTLAENEYIDIVKKIVTKYDINVNQLEFEITESNETMDTQKLKDYIRQIKELGIGISLDDVGTDYSSFPMLIMGDIDTVKLDRSLIIQIKNQKAYKLLKHVTDMCHDLGMKVIAEGVENDEVRIELASMECDYYQGYLLSKPVSSEDFYEKYLA